MSIESVWRTYTFVKLRKRVPFFYSGLHDMESVVWIIFAVLLNVKPGDAETRYLIVRELFSGSVGKIQARAMFLAFPEINCTHYEKLLGMDRVDVLDALLAVRDVLIRFYREVEATMVDGAMDCSKLCGIHAEFVGIWSRCGEMVGRADVEIDADASPYRLG